MTHIVFFYIGDLFPKKDENPCLTHFTYYKNIIIPHCTDDHDQVNELMKLESLQHWSNYYNSQKENLFSEYLNYCRMFVHYW